MARGRGGVVADPGACTGARHDPGAGGGCPAWNLIDSTFLDRLDIGQVLESSRRFLVLNEMAA